jgi:hypothetical protein
METPRDTRGSATLSPITGRDNSLINTCWRNRYHEALFFLFVRALPPKHAGMKEPHPSSVSLFPIGRTCASVRVGRGVGPVVLRAGCCCYGGYGAHRKSRFSLWQAPRSEGDSQTLTARSDPLTVRDKTEPHSQSTTSNMAIPTPVGRSECDADEKNEENEKKSLSVTWGLDEKEVEKQILKAVKEMIAAQMHEADQEEGQQVAFSLQLTRTPSVANGSSEESLLPPSPTVLQRTTRTITTMRTSSPGAFAFVGPTNSLPRRTFSTSREVTSPPSVLPESPTIIATLVLEDGRHSSETPSGSFVLARAEPMPSHGTGFPTKVWWTRRGFYARIIFFLGFLVLLGLSVVIVPALRELLSGNGSPSDASFDSAVDLSTQSLAPSASPPQVIVTDSEDTSASTPVPTMLRSRAPTHAPSRSPTVSPVASLTREPVLDTFTSGSANTETNGDSSDEDEEPDSEDR